MKWRPLSERERGVSVPVAGTFQQLITPHRDAAYNLARWLMQDATTAEDVVQDAVLRALTYFGSYKGSDPRAVSSHREERRVRRARRSAAVWHDKPG